MSYAKYGPWAVIAGGSEGVGAEFARLLAESGVNLVLVARKPEPLEVTAAACRGLGVEVHTLATDLVSPPDAITELTALTDGLEVGLFVYNAGANTCSAEFLDADLADFSAGDRPEHHHDDGADAALRTVDARAAARRDPVGRFDVRVSGLGPPHRVRRGEGLWADLRRGPVAGVARLRRRRFFGAGARGSPAHLRWNGSG